MTSKILIRLIDYAIVPAALLVFSKVVGIIFLANFFGASFAVKGLSLVFNDMDSFVAVNSYSSLFMLITVIAGIIWVLVKAHLFHDTHITPLLSSRLHDSDLHELISSTKTIYMQSFIWLFYVWLITFVLAAQSFYALSFPWILYLSLGISVVVTAVMVVDIDRELDRDRKASEANDDGVSKTIKFASLREAVFS